MGLIHDDVLPFELLQLGHAESDTLESSEANVELAWLQIVLENLLSFEFGGNEVEQAHFGAPLFELEFPVGNDGLRHNDNEVVVNFLELPQERQECNSLDRFSKSLHN